MSELDPPQTMYRFQSTGTVVRSKVEKAGLQALSQSNRLARTLLLANDAKGTHRQSGAAEFGVFS